MGTSPVTTRTDLIASARASKALRLAAVLREAGADAETAAALDSQGRRNAEAAAGVRESSDATWALVMDTMRRTCAHGYVVAGPRPPVPAVPRRPVSARSGVPG